MFVPGTRVIGYTYTDDGRIRIEGTVICRTDDPEEMWQAYYITTDAGETYCCDEQEVYLLPRPDPRDVPLDRNLTELRLPASARDAKTIRVIIWETDADTGARSILDIVEGGRREIIRWFNRHRQQWAEQGRTNTARIEEVP